MQGCTMALVATLGLGALPSVVRAEPFQTLTVEVLTVNQAGVPQGILVRAERAAARIFSAIGIRLEWTNVANSAQYSQRPHQLKVNIVTDSARKLVGQALGVALRPQEDRSMLACAFYPRIEDLAQRHGADIADVLGHVLAHELGHHLLSSYDFHSSRGIMRERIDQAQLERMAKGQLAFTADEAKLIRSRTRAFATNP